MPKLSIFMYPGEYRCAPTSNTTRRGDILLYIRYSYLKIINADCAGTITSDP